MYEAATIIAQHDTDRPREKAIPVFQVMVQANPGAIPPTEGILETDEVVAANAQERFDPCTGGARATSNA
jgi:hypothetical protein